MTDWISTRDQMPDLDTTVLIVLCGNIRMGELRFEHPSYEDTHNGFEYWDDPYDEGQCWDFPDVTHWTPLPSLPDVPR